MTDDGFEQPRAPQLLEIARATLLDSLLPSLTGADRFKALMIANAMAIAGRELATDPAGLRVILTSLQAVAGGDARQLGSQIRAGRHDPGSNTHDRVGRLLLEIAEFRCRVSAPRAVAGGKARALP